MAVGLYMDHNVPRAIADGLRMRGVNILTAIEDASNELEDPDLLDRSTELNRVLFTRDYNLLQEAAKRQRNHIHFGGIIYAHQLRISIGSCIRDLEIIANVANPEDFESVVEYLPLK